MKAAGILLVEDNQADAELTIRALRTRHLANEIVCVGDGAAALEFVFASGQFVDRAGEPMPLLVILDNRLPKIDGIDVLRRLRADARTMHLPVISMVSSNAERDLIERCDLGANSIVVKPVEFEPFVEMVAQVGLSWMIVNPPPAAA